GGRALSLLSAMARCAAWAATSPRCLCARPWLALSPPAAGDRLQAPQAARAMKHALPSSKLRRQRVNDPDGTRRNIIDIATEEFAGKGFSGARVDEIATRTKTSKRMIYYYFGGKAGLYIAVLEAAYRNIRTIEANLDLDQQEPEAALR